MPIPLIGKLIKGFVGTQGLIDSSNVDVDNSLLPLLSTNSQGSFESLQRQISNIIAPTPQAFRPFRVFSGGTLVSNVNFRIENITLDGSNFAQWNNVNNIYSAQRVDKNVQISLPTDAEIATSAQSYPVAIEITHLGGSGRLDDRNLVIPQIKGADSATQIETVANGNQGTTTIQQGDVVVLTKSAAGQNWIESRATHIPSQALLPSGVFDLQTERMIQNIANISTELSGVSIDAGDAFEIVVGGTYFGQNIRPRDVIVALQDNPDLTTNSDDWLVIENGSSSLTQDQVAFFNNVARSGTRFDLSRNVFVNSANVATIQNAATGLPLTYNYSDSFQDATSRTRTFQSQPIQFTGLTGGKLRLVAQFNASSFSGFSPDLTSLTLDYGSGNTFVFPLTNISAEGGLVNVEITIPNADYSSILNTNCSVILNYNFRGNSFAGSFTIMSVMNFAVGTLHDSVIDLANSAAMSVEQRLQSQIDQVQNGVDEESANFAAIQDRISSYRQDSINTPVQGALFGESTGSDTFPSDLSTLTTVNPSNPRYTATTTSVFVAVPVSGRQSFILSNITQNSVVILANGQANVTLGESLQYQGATYFVYRVGGIAISDILEVQLVQQVQRVAWQEDINHLKEEVLVLEAEAINLPDALKQVLETEVTVTEQTNPSLAPTPFNNSLGSGGTQKIFTQTSDNAPSSGSINSLAISEQTGSRNKRKIVYIGTDHQYGNSDLLSAFDGTSTTLNLVRYQNGELQARQFIPAVPQGSQNVIIYPSPSNRVAGAGIWQTIPTLTFQNGVPVTEADELFFTRDVPTQGVTLNIQYRGHANGNLFGAGTTTLANVGGSSEVAQTFTINDGSETATIEVRYYPNFHNSGRAIRVSVTERVNTGLPTIQDVQVILSYNETRTIPATPASFRYVEIEQQAATGHSNTIAIKPSSTNTIVVVGSDTEIDTGYAYNSAFGATEGGHLVVFSDQARFFDYENIEIINTTVQALERESNQPNFGLFITQYTHATIVELGTQLIVSDSSGNRYNIGDALAALGASALP